MHALLPFLLEIHSAESTSSPPLPRGHSPMASYMKSWNDNKAQNWYVEFLKLRHLRTVFNKEGKETC